MDLEVGIFSAGVVIITFLIISKFGIEVGVSVYLLLIFMYTKHNN